MVPKYLLPTSTQTNLSVDYYTTWCRPVDNSIADKFMDEVVYAAVLNVDTPDGWHPLVKAKVPSTEPARIKASISR